MGAWPGKYVIGLTGNIGTGKSVVRKMLEHLGAYGIDADALAHRAIAHGAPGYQAVIDLFGKWILAADGQIDRSRLARLVFTDPDALQRLENVVHPLVSQAVDILIRRAAQPVVVVEAIKLIESGLAGRCDALWVTYAPEALQIQRLVEKRGMSEAEARLRIAAQPAQEQKMALAHVVIRNEGSFEDTWKQVYWAYQRTFPNIEVELPQPAQPAGVLGVQRARPREADEIAALITRLSGGKRKMDREQVMAAFGEKAFLLLKLDEKNVGVAGWEVENLVARTNDVYLESQIPFLDGMRVLLNEVERTSRELQCEISLLFFPGGQAGLEAAMSKLGYQPRSPSSLGVRAWEEAAQETYQPGQIMFFKQLRQDRVLRPV